MPKDYIETASAATLSQSELFARFLEAKLRDASAQSTLVEVAKGESISAEKNFLGYHGTEFVCFKYDFAERMLGELRDCEDPEAEIEMAIGDLESLLKGLKFLQRDFDMVCHLTRTARPDKDAPDEVYRDWENNPRYVLPVIEQKDAA